MISNAESDLSHTNIARVSIKLTIFFNLNRTDVDRLIDQILLEEPLISESRKPQLKKLIESKY